MAGLKGKSGPPGKMNAFKHWLAAIQKRREGEHYHRARRETGKITESALMEPAFFRHH
jgi:hypothetical protein